ncbi:PREDICTED: uncharacterized protein LOC104597588 isoform X2 [Nelumbo nucifera]|uniref:Uncharacterized protein LOC104597588 isoform X2 n=1 Tax=Nelumbo nucifera TaxID=4432 RepID=A0A1U8A6L3_NELNU|nr:PREDICTED: uncharacterized protein LOC104597588 isoform X2 [Nelumbo nucifera]
MLNSAMLHLCYIRRRAPPDRYRQMESGRSIAMTLPSISFRSSGVSYHPMLDKSFSGLISRCFLNKLQEGVIGHLPSSRAGALRNQNDGVLNIMPSCCQDDIQDPSVHPWGGLAATRDGILTILDCFIEAKSLKPLQNVFDSARARERERELLYPDACGGGGRGWMSQGVVNYGRGHGTRETCALHTARLSCDTLVDFWSALGDETRQSLLRMKEEDFIEKLMYRFDSKRFCRDCRRNVIREFKELKELKRMRREPRCTSWFCVADTAFQYEVSDDTVHADWHQSFIDNVGTYHHFEWALGTGEGKSDILEFEDVGMNGSVQVNGLDLGGLNSCFITVRAWKLDGRCTELSVKAHALKGQPCVHRRLVVGDGFVTITKGESIRRFFEHAEEAEEEEDDDSMDKDGNELDGENSRPQKHAKSPELAREFLLDAATVIFKEQVEKAFREGTARQNAHSIFVCLTLKLLEERVHVACKEIITLEKQIKLLEEEEKEKREEEERKERRRTKEREKKLRRKERLKGKERDREKKGDETKQIPTVPEASIKDSSPSVDAEPNKTIISEDAVDAVSETGDDMLGMPPPDAQDEQPSNGSAISNGPNLKNDSAKHTHNVAEGDLCAKDGNGSFTIEHSKSSRRKLRFRKEFQTDLASKWCEKHRSAVVYDSRILFDESERKFRGTYTEKPSKCINGVIRQRGNTTKLNTRNSGPRLGEKSHCFNKARDRYDFHSISCNQHGDYRSKDSHHISVIRSCQESKFVCKSESASDMPRPFFRNKYNYGSYMSDSCGNPKSKVMSGNIPPSRDLFHIKKVWEPLEARKKYPRSNSDSDVTLKSSTFRVDGCEGSRCNGDEIGLQQPDNLLKSTDELYLHQLSGNSGNVDDSDKDQCHKDRKRKESRNSSPSIEGCQNRFGLGSKAPYCSKDAADEEAELCPSIASFSRNGASDPTMSSTSSSDNFSSCLSEGDSSTASSSTQNVESLSISDSEDASQHSEGRDASTCGGNGFHSCQDVGADDQQSINGGGSFTSGTVSGFPVASCAIGSNFPREPPIKCSHTSENGRVTVDMGSQQHTVLPPMPNQSVHLPVFPAPSTIGYYHQNPASWQSAPANGLMPFPQPNGYLFTSHLGYGLSANQPSHFCMQYSGLHHLRTPVLNVGQFPVYQPVNRANNAISKEQNNNAKLVGSQEAINVADKVVNERPLETTSPSGQNPSQTLLHKEDRCTVTSKLNNDNKNFSLFHFGGPIAVATGYELNPVSMKEGMVGNFSPNSPADPAMDDHTCTKKETTVEEYNLFAASNGTRFSFF